MFFPLHAYEIRIGCLCNLHCMLMESAFLRSPFFYFLNTLKINRIQSQSEDRFSIDTYCIFRTIFYQFPFPSFRARIP